MIKNILLCTITMSAAMTAADHNPENKKRPREEKGNQTFFDINNSPIPCCADMSMPLLESKKAQDLRETLQERYESPKDFIDVFVKIIDKIYERKIPENDTIVVLRSLPSMSDPVVILLQSEICQRLEHDKGKKSLFSTYIKKIKSNAHQPPDYLKFPWAAQLSKDNIDSEQECCLSGFVNAIHSNNPVNIVQAAHHLIDSLISYHTLRSKEQANAGRGSRYFDRFSDKEIGRMKQIFKQLPNKQEFCDELIKEIDQRHSKRQ